jgi:Protein of unknown function (DUF2950)
MRKVNEMSRIMTAVTNWKWKNRIATALLPAIVFAAINVEDGFAQQLEQRTFASAEAAASSLFLAVQRDDVREVMNILQAGNELASTGDASQDKLEREQFVEKYQEMHRLVREPDNITVLYIGAENWPFPIPLVSDHGVWRFDSEAGGNEVLFRRIGENEANVIGTFPLLHLAEQEFRATPRNADAVPHYANYFRVTSATPNGLYSGSDSAIPEALAKAGLDAPALATGSQVPFHGYYFRILTAQGKHAPGGAKDYISEGRMTGGFAFIAYPAAYGSSGVKTFMAGPNGRIYEKDLGPNTANTASAITEYDPDASWHLAEQYPEL